MELPAREPRDLKPWQSALHKRKEAPGGASFLLAAYATCVTGIDASVIAL